VQPAELLSGYASKDERLLIGLMSGTSADAVTAAAVKLRGSVPDVQVQMLGHHQHPIPGDIAAGIRSPTDLTAADVARLNACLGELFAQAALRAIEELGLSPDSVDAIASHGQTIVHLPDHRATLQVGEPSIIAERTGILTVAEFRYRDMAAGGQGAPLVALADYALFRSDTVSRAVQNIGGIANVTWLPAGGALDDVLAFDTGPGNMVIDEVVRLGTRGEGEMDEDGLLASRGRVDESHLARLLEHPFLELAPPKSAGREQFGREYTGRVYEELRADGLSLEDCVATVTALTAAAIAHSYREHLPALPDEIIVGGGGAHNPSLLGTLRELLPEARLRTHAGAGIPDVAKEAAAFAILANESLLGRPGNVPSATGARKAVPLGKIVLP
jgi:anhydro-N-acetylmuramic acid kinase